MSEHQKSLGLYGPIEEALVEEIRILRRALEAAKIGCDNDGCQTDLILSYEDSPCDCDPERDREKHNEAIDRVLKEGQKRCAVSSPRTSPPSVTR